MEAKNPQFIANGKPILAEDIEAKAALTDMDISSSPRAQVALAAHRLLYCEYCLVFLAVVYASIMVAMIVSLLYRAPYEPIFWVFVICLVLYWLNAFGVVFLNRRIQNQTENGSSKCMNIIKKPGIWLLCVTLVISFACMLIMVKFILPESFSPTGGLIIHRLGSVTDTTARFGIRDPSRGQDTSVTVEYRLSGTSDAFIKSASAALLTAEKDYTGFVSITGLTPATAYEWRFEGMQETLSFRTNPSAGTPSKFSFYFGSCFLNGFPNFQEAPGFNYVADMNPDLFFFVSERVRMIRLNQTLTVRQVGDFIYSDIPFFRNDDVATYHSLYRQSFKNPGVKRVFERIPNYQMWDDHEVRNDYPDVRSSNLYRSPGSYENSITNGWQVYIGGGNPAPAIAGKTFFELDYGDSAFAVIDTRGYRTSRELPDDASKSILGSEQKQWLKSWLLAKNTTSKFKFIVSPLGFTADFGEVIDSWGGFKTERNELIDFIRDNRIEGVMVLTGDSHFAYVTNIDGAPGGSSGGLYEASASPISAFDRSLGGFRSLIGIPEEAFKPIELREDEVLFYSEGQKGATSLIGIVRVDTTLPVPEVKVELYDTNILIYNRTFVASDLRAWEGV